MSASRICKRVRVGLALSGGGGRGLAQVGVLKSLERAGISIDVIAGTSVVAIIGGVYACWPDAAELEKRVLAFVRSKYIESLNLATIRRLGGIPMIGEEEAEHVDPGVFDRLQTAFRGLYASHLALSRRAILSGERVQRVLEAVFDGRTFEDTEIPFGAVAVDLHEGCEVIIGPGLLHGASPPRRRSRESSRRSRSTVACCAMGATPARYRSTRSKRWEPTWPLRSTYPSTASR